MQGSICTDFLRRDQLLVFCFAQYMWWLLQNVSVCSILTPIPTFRKGRRKGTEVTLEISFEPVCCGFKQSKSSWGKTYSRRDTGWSQSCVGIWCLFFHFRFLDLGVVVQLPCRLYEVGLRYTLPWWNATSTLSRYAVTVFFSPKTRLVLEEWYFRYWAEMQKFCGHKVDW